MWVASGLLMPQGVLGWTLASFLGVGWWGSASHGVGLLRFTLFQGRKHRLQQTVIQQIGVQIHCFCDAHGRECIIVRGQGGYVPSRYAVHKSQVWAGRVFPAKYFKSHWFIPVWGVTFSKHSTAG